MKLINTPLLIGALLVASASHANAVEIVSRLDCAPANEKPYTGVNHCKTVKNECGVPIELHVVDNKTHTGSGSGQIEDHQSGEACTSNTNAVDHYTIYSKRKRKSGLSDGSYSASVDRSWVNATGQTSSDTQNFTMRIANGIINLTAAGFSVSLPPQGSGSGTYSGLPVQCRDRSGASRIEVVCTNEGRGQTTTWNYVVNLIDGRCQSASMNQESRFSSGFGRWTTKSASCQ